MKGTSFLPKQVALSTPMTYTHISGVYTFFTGEANVNVNYPDYVVAFSAAHEMAHQRGISREDEANFVAFLVCLEAQEPFLRYSGYLNLCEYLMSALYSASPALYRSVMATLDARAWGDLSAYSAFMKKYADNPAASVSNAINNAYLTSQGTPGIRSYNLVVDLAVSYYRSCAYTES